MNRPGNRSTGYTWLRDALIPGENALLDALWVYPWISLALASTRSTAHVRFPFLWLIGLMAVPALGGRWLERSFSGRLILRRLALLLLVACIFLLFMRTQALSRDPIGTTRWLGEALWPWSAGATGDRQNLIAFGWLVGCVLLVRGIWLAEAEVTGVSASRWFLIGLAAFLLLFVDLLHAPPAAYAADRHWLGPLLALYFLLGIGWVALVQQQRIEEQTFRRRSNRLSRAWLAVLTSVGAVMVLVAVLVTVLGVLALHPVAQSTVFLLGGIWQGAVWVWDAVLFLLHAIFSLLPHGSAHPHTNPPRAGASPPHGSGGMLPWLGPVLFVLLLILGIPSVLCGIVLIVYLGARLVLAGSRSQMSSVGDDESVSVWSWTLFLTQIRSLAQLLAARWRRRRSRSQRVEPAGSDRPTAPPPGSVRGLYRSVLQLCRERNRARRPDETPREFEPALARQVSPDLARDLTSAYIKVRYGGVSFSQAEIGSLADRWREDEREAAEYAESLDSARPENATF